MDSSLGLEVTNEFILNSYLCADGHLYSADSLSRIKEVRLYLKVKWKDLDSISYWGKGIREEMVGTQSKYGVGGGGLPR